MPVITTDDQARRLRNVWLGGNGFEWGFAARYSAWGVASLLFVLGCLVAVVLLPPLPTFVVGVPAAGAVAIWTTRKLMRHVGPERTVTSHIKTFRAEVYAPRPDDDVHEYVVAITPDLLEAHR